MDCSTVFFVCYVSKGSTHEENLPVSTLSFYSERAAECRAEAAATGLANVRHRCLNAAFAWDTMADRVEGVARRVAEGRPA